MIAEIRIFQSRDRHRPPAPAGQNLLYTAVNRGKRLVVIVEQRKALAIAVRMHGRKPRGTKLKEWLSGR
jgi:hypothetical protein